MTGDKNRADEIRLLEKELRFLDARWEAFKSNLRTVSAGRVTFIVKGVASPAFAHVLYLEGRRQRAAKRLEELRAMERADG